MRIRKNTIDTADYSFVKLENGVKILTVSDPTIDKCSCALSMKIGSFDEPAEFEGLAHFLEHMLFMGTEQYPGENEYNEYLGMHNGYSNAYTCGDVTVYYFDVQPSAFEGAIDRFSAFFKSPLFLQDSVEREISAVDSEFSNGLNNDNWRNYRLREIFSRNETPFSRFTVGNDNTLRRDGILEEVKGFWRKAYCAEDACVVIYGSQSTAELKEFAKMFEQIPKRNQQLPRTNWGYEVFRSECLNKAIRVKPIKDQKSLLVSICLPPEYPIFKENPYQYIAEAFNSGDEKGFICHLKDRGLAFSASFCDDKYLNHTIVSISIYLTPKGEREYKEVLGYLSRYFTNLNVSPEEYKILKDVHDCLFEHREKVEPICLTESLSEKMQFYPIENVLDCDYAFEKFDRTLIQDALDILSNTDKWLVMLFDKTYTCESKEDIYGIEYSIGETIFSPSMLNSWITVDHTALLTTKAPQDQILQENRQNGKILYLFNESYQVPKACFNILLKLDKMTERNVEFYIFIKNVEEVFFRRHHGLLKRYQVGIHLEINIDGIFIRIEGFSHGLLSITKLFIDVFFEKNHFNSSQLVLEEIKSEFLEEKFGYPYTRLKSGLFQLLIPGSLSVEQKLEYVEKFNKTLSPPVEFFIELFAVGNIAQSEVVAAFDHISSKQLGYKVNLGRLELLKNNLRHEISTSDKENNAVGVYYHICSCTDYLQIAISNLLLKIYQEAFFDQLRTKEELGYIVFASMTCVYDSFYFCFVVQGEKNADFLENRVLEFVSEIEDLVESLDEETFDSYKEAAVNFFEEEEKNLFGYNSFLWDKYTQGVIDLTYGKKLANIVSSLTKEHLLASSFFDVPYCVRATLEENK